MPVTQEEIEKSVEILRSYGATRILLFGSAAETPETAHDLDLAVDGIEGRAFFTAGAKVEDELDLSLDLVPLTPPSRFARYIERKGRVLYDRPSASED